MFSKNMREIYNRFLILGLLLMCLFVFGFSEKIETAHAGACLQDCIKYEEICDDNCRTSCATNSRDMDCNSCLSNCLAESNSCYEHSIYCTSGTVSYDPQCEVQFGRHCIGSWLDNPSCDATSGGHNGYYLKCNKIGYADGCLECPDGEACCPIGGPCGNGNQGGTPQCL